MAPDTSDYPSTKAPETAEHAEERDSVVDPRLIPGGAEPRTDTPQGMEGLDRRQLPGGADDDTTTDPAGNQLSR